MKDKILDIIIVLLAVTIMVVLGYVISGIAQVFM
jgi:hypothetical protein